MCQELANLLRSLVETGGPDIQLETVKVIQQVVGNVEKDFFSKSGGDVLLHHLLETVIFTIHHNLRSLNTLSKAGKFFLNIH